MSIVALCAGGLTLIALRRPPRPRRVGVLRGPAPPLIASGLVSLIVGSAGMAGGMNAFSVVGFILAGIAGIGGGVWLHSKGPG